MSVEMKFALALLSLLLTAACSIAEPPIQEITYDDGQEWRQAIRLNRQRDGHFYVNTLVNGKPIKFMVDTGATLTVLTMKDAQSLGFDFDKEEKTLTLKSAAGEITAKQVKLRNINIGKKEGWDIRAAIVPEGLTISLLGQNYLQLRKITIDGDQMVLR
jgi:aspartyl protease family protein